MTPKSECSSLTSRCQACGCYTSFYAPTLIEALALQGATGWVFRGGVGWLCPVCAQETPQKFTLDEPCMWPKARAR